MEQVAINVFQNEFKIIPHNKINDGAKELISLYKLLENNRENLIQFYVDMALIDEQQSFLNLVKMSKDFSLVYKNCSLIGCIYIKQWGKYDEINFWLDKNSRETKIFSEIISLYIKTYVKITNSDLIVWNVRNKSIESKKIVKKIGFKNSFKYNSKIPLFDSKKIISTNLFFKSFKQDFSFSLELANMYPEDLEKELEIFLIDLVDYEFKRNNFIFESKYGKYYWSGLDLTDDMKEVYFINIAKSKSSYKKIIKKISINEEYLDIYKSSKRFYIVFNSVANATSILFIGDKLKKWVHFDNSLM